MKRDFHGKIFLDAISEDSKEHTVLGKTSVCMKQRRVFHQVDLGKHNGCVLLF